MIFKKIRLKNFRQYKNEHIFEFSSDKDKSISLLIAENGVGKTTFIQAFRFCFYGNFKDNKYLKLPKPQELLNDTIVNELSDGDVSEMFVEVTFEHNNTEYIMKRNIDYKKMNMRMISNNSYSSLSQGTQTEGFNTVQNDEADIEMNKILPAGLSHIFMFDGERMEREIGSSEFKRELKESILGILNLKKYDALLELLGDENRKQSVIGRLNGQKQYTEVEGQIKKTDLNRFKDELENQEEKQESIVEQMEKIKIDIKALKIIQKQLTSLNEKQLLLEQYENKIEMNEKTLNHISEQIVDLGLKLVRIKVLLEFKDKFDTVKSNGLDNDNFYRYIHIETLNEILERHRCICGTAIHNESPQKRELDELKLVALPHSSSQHISYIESDIYSETSEYDIVLGELKDLQNQKANILSQLQQYSATKIKIQEEISEIESIYGKRDQKEIEQLEQTSEQLIREKALIEKHIEDLKKVIKKTEQDLRPHLDNTEKNLKIARAIRDLYKLKIEIEEEKSTKEEFALKILSKHFNDEIMTVMSGNYETIIKPDYSIKVIDVDKSQDETEVLSTGQNVVSTVSFIKALIKTAKEISSNYDSNSKYGVIMDAALSNLDETHIRKISDSNLRQLEQLIFLSYKRQLRDEMFDSIKDNIGIAYVIEKHGLEITSEEKNINELYEYIHKMEGENEEN